MSARGDHFAVIRGARQTLLAQRRRGVHSSAVEQDARRSEMRCRQGEVSPGKKQPDHSRTLGLLVRES